MEIEWVAAYAEKYKRLCLPGDACNENLGRNQDWSLLVGNEMETEGT